MEIVTCSTTHEKEIFEYIFQKRPNWNTQEFRKLWVLGDDRSGTVQVIDNRNGTAEYHKFEFGQYMMYHEKLVMECCKLLYPEGESK